jgi:hypothetical protein
MEELLMRTFNSIESIRRILFPQALSLAPTRPAPTPELLESYWNACVVTLKGRKEDSLVSVLEDALVKHESGVLSKTELMMLVAFCLAGEDRLILGFDLLLPAGLSMAHLLVFTKLVVALSVQMDASLIVDSVRQRLAIRRGLRELHSALKSPMSEAKPIITSQNYGFPSDSASVLAVETSPTMIQDPSQALVDWIDTLVARYWGSNELDRVENALEALSKLDECQDAKSRAQVLTAVREFVPEGDLRLAFEAIAQSYIDDKPLAAPAEAGKAAGMALEETSK